mmetsp:Transcript_52572/g.163166  ORF Transcript_52572/g.163166 Transcript_52572/m.163166 type:complete len:203 (-) Transcript_52572:150-758(-)
MQNLHQELRVALRRVFIKVMAQPPQHVHSPCMRTSQGSVGNVHHRALSRGQLLLSQALLHVLIGMKLYHQLLVLLLENPHVDVKCFLCDPKQLEVVAIGCRRLHGSAGTAEHMLGTATMIPRHPTVPAIELLGQDHRASRGTWRRAARLVRMRRRMLLYLQLFNNLPVLLRHCRQAATMNHAPCPHSPKGPHLRLVPCQGRS